MEREVLEKSHWKIRLHWKSNVNSACIWVCFIFAHRYIFSRGPEAKKSPLFSWHNFNDFMEKEPCTKFCGVLISSHECYEVAKFSTGHK